MSEEINQAPEVQQVSLSPPDLGDNPQPVTLAPDAATPPQPPSNEVAERRTFKTQYGLGDVLKKSKDEIYQLIAQGREDILRKEAASTLDFKNALAKQDAIRDIASKKGGPLTQAEVARILDPNLPTNKPINPDDVIERSYAHKYVTDAVDKASLSMGSSSIINDARREIPEQLDATEQKSSVLASKIEFAKTIQENLDQQISSQGFAPWLVDIAKTMFQPYNEYKLRGNNRDVGGISGGILLSDNIKEQADQLFLLPIDEYKDRFTKIVENLSKDNPTLAKQFADYVIGVSTSERHLGNLYTMLAPLDYATVGKLGLNVVKKVTAYNQVQKAFKDIVKSVAHSDGEIPARAVASEAAGDVTEAGVVRAADNIVKTVEGRIDPIKDIKEKFTSNFRLDGDRLAENPGSLSREQLTRLKDSFYKAGDDLWDNTLNSLRVNRTPLPLATEDALRAYKEASKRSFPGLDNALLDVSSPKYEPITNTYHVEHTFGNIGGDLFSNPQTAQNFAKLHGFADVEVVADTGRVETQAARVEGSAKDLRRKTQLENQISELPSTIKRTKTKANDKTLEAAERAKAREDLKFFNTKLKEYTDQLAEINSRVTQIPARIEQQGLGYKFVVTKPYEETTDVVRNFLINDKDGNLIQEGISTASAKGFNSWKNAALGWIRTAEDTLSFNESVQRKVATYTQSIFNRWSKEVASDMEQVATGVIRKDPVTGEAIPYWLAKPRAIVGKISQKKMFDEFNEVLNYARKATDPDTGELGYFFKTPGEIEDHYQRFYQRMPSFPEIEGYFAHVKLTEGNRVLAEVAEFRNRARLGAAQHEVFIKGEDGKRVGSEFFDGVLKKQFPGGDDQILIMGERKGEERLHNLGGNSISDKNLKDYKQQVLDGRAKVIEIYNPDSHPLRNFSEVAGNERIRYVMTTDAETKPLDFNHVNRRGGGHFEYDHDHFIKQANIIPQHIGSTVTDKRTVFKHVYTGDTTVMAINNRALGKDISKKLEEVRKLIKDDRLDVARVYTQNHLPMEWEEVIGWFTPKRDPNGNILRPHLSKDEPFYVVPKNKKIYDLDKSLESRYPKTFKDGTKSGSLAQQYQVSYNIQRDAVGLKTIEDIGTKGNPLYQYIPAKLVDPIPTMNRALQRAIKSTFMDDYKINAVEHWLQEASPHLKASESEIRSAPFWHFNNPDFKSGADKAAVWNLKSNQYKIRQFLGTPDTFDTWIHGLTQHLADSFYTKFGPEEGRSITGKAVTIVPLAALSRVHDPIQFIRSVVYNAKLGLFNVAQMLVQAQSHATIWALEPRHGTVGTFSSMLHTWARLNSDERILQSLDNYATKLNMFGSKWKPGEWLEARRELANTGFEHVAGEYIVADDALHYKAIKSEKDNFLDAGQFFFREGEKSTRLTAWYTAFREFREANPIGALSNADRAEILQKADLLTTNMSRASASMLHGGVLSISTQFLSYQLRIAELFLGKRIGETVGERALARARIVLAYSSLYGAPNALGVTGFPFGDSIRKYAVDNGYVVGDNFLSSLAMEGLPSLMGAMITGNGDYQKGNFYNIGDRYGVQGFTQVREALRSDASWWKVAAGAGGSVFANIFSSFDPFWKAAQSLVSTSGEKDNAFPLKSADFVDLFNEISSVSAAQKLIMAMNTGRWMSKNEAYITDVSKTNALFMSLTGLTVQEQDEIFAKTSINKENEALQKEALKGIIKDYHRGLDAVRDNNPTLANDMFKRVRLRFELTDYPQDKRATALAIASKGYESQIERSNFEFATKNVPAGKEQTRLDAYKRQLQLQNGKR